MCIVRVQRLCKGALAWELFFGLTNYVCILVIMYRKRGMLAYLAGTIKSVQTQLLVVDVGNFGLAVQVPQETMFQVQQKVQLFTHMHWNQEQGPSLFGFISEAERSIFVMVISCAGMGPKIALALSVTISLI